MILKAPTLSFARSAVQDDVQNSNDFLEKAGESFSKRYKKTHVTVKVIQYDNNEEYEQIEKR